MKNKLWAVLILGLMVLLLASSLHTTTSYFVDSETSAGNNFQAWTSTQWVQTTQAHFEAGVPSNVSTSTSPGLVKLATGSRNQLYAFRGASADFWRYNIATNSWAPPLTVGAGGALACDGANYVYALRGGATTDFWRYDIAGNSWTAMAAAPATVSSGGALAYAGPNYIYALRGASTAFWRYDIAANSWTAMAVTPASVTLGGALVYDGSSYIYAFRGGSTTFWRYNIAGNSWTAMAVAPASVGTGGALAYAGPNYIYASRGGTTADFWRYDIAGNSWTAMAVAPATVSTGGSLACDGANYIYAFRGASTTTFWRYDIAGNSWTAMTVAPASVSSGGALTPVIQYVGSGTIASQVLDTGADGATWEELSWDEMLPTNSDITFEVRASDTEFLKDAAAPSWIPVGDSSPVIGGLPSGRYMQWRATLVSFTEMRTPMLLEVRVDYY